MSIYSNATDEIPITLSQAYGPALAAAHAASLMHLQALPTREVRAVAVPSSDDLVAAFAEAGKPATEVVEHLVATLGPGTVASNGGRYFGFVNGATLPASLAADWLVSCWDQNAALPVMAPGTLACEEATRRIVLDLLDLPRDSAIGFVTGSQMATWGALATARRVLLERRGWDVDRQGLFDAPRLRVLVGELRHVTIDRAVSFLGLGRDAIQVVVADEEGGMNPEALRQALSQHPECPTIVCAQAGEVNTGAFDLFEPLTAACREAGAWLHVDGAFGLWARACARKRALTTGVELADSWSTDAHKWLNTPYDGGMVICRHATAHHQTFQLSASYLHAGSGPQPRVGVGESSRRARAVPMYAALLELGRSGVDELVDRCCRRVESFARRLSQVQGMEVLRPPRINQLLVRCGDSDRVTAEVARRAQEEGVCWVGTTRFRNHLALRISVSSWLTTETDVERSCEALQRALSDQLPGGGL